MKKLFIIFILLSSIVLAQNTVNVHVFYGQGCPHCGSLINYFDLIQESYPEMNVSIHEVYFNADENKLFHEFAEVYGLEVQGVPTTFIGNKVISGYASWLEDDIANEIVYCIENECIDPYEKVYSNLTGNSSVVIDGDVSYSEKRNELTLLLVLGAATVDAVNPCAFAVLVILLSSILVADDKKKALFAGLAFSLSIFISYFLMGLGLFTAIQTSSLSGFIFKLLGFFAIVVGVFNLKDFLNLGACGFVMEVPMSWRPKMKSLIKGVTSVPGAFLIGFVISLFLLPCTSGPYIVILGLLANQLTRTYAIPWLLLYNFIFVLPMILITFAVYYGLSTTEKAEKWRVSKLRYMHLIAGLLMIGMGIYLIWMM